MIDIRRRARLPLWCAAALLTTLAAVSCESGGSTPSPATVTSERATATPVPAAPTPTALPADPGLGARLAYEGEYEAAIDVYESVADETEGDAQQDALFAQAQLLVRTERYAEARTALEAYLANAGSADTGAARYMLATVLDALDDPGAALAQYDAYLAIGGVLAPYARVERARILARLGRIAEAQAAAEQALADPALDGRGGFLFDLAAAFEEAGADVEALAWYDRARAEGGDAASALARSGAIRRRLGDPSWTADYLAAVEDYPASRVAAALVDELDAAGVPVSDYRRGFVYYRAFRNGEATAALRRAVAAGEHVAEATYYLAALEERAGAYGIAAERYALVPLISAQSPVADDALWWRGTLLETAGAYEDASVAFGQLVARYPASEYASDAGFHRGMVLYRSGRYDAAASAWGSMATVATDTEDRARARFWQARALIDAGDEEAGRVALARVSTEYEGDFYALRAEALLGEGDDGGGEPQLDTAAPDWAAIADYIASVTAVHPDTLPPIDDPRWTAADELETVGLTAAADGLRQNIVNDYDTGDVTRFFRVVRRLAEEGYASLAARAATRLMASLPGGAPEPPRDLQRVAYPLAYGDLVAQTASRENIDPLLLLALVRQESYYDPRAGSSAGALGLTQVIEPTGRAIADALGVAPFAVEDLFRPKLSLRFGANYLSDQLTAFDGNAYHALAAYNGGPGTSSNAIDAAGDDLDLFVEELEFDETRLYVKLVLEHYAQYRYLYAGADHPSLPD